MRKVSKASPARHGVDLSPLTSTDYTIVHAPAASCYTAFASRGIMLHSNRWDLPMGQTNLTNPGPMTERFGRPYCICEGTVRTCQATYAGRRRGV
jgi:hypothetical protein